MTVYYEWDVETLDEDGEIIDHWHFNTAKEAVDFCNSFKSSEHETGFNFVLVRDCDKQRAWAYLDEGALPESFYNALDQKVAKVPQRFIEELKECKFKN